MVSSRDKRRKKSKQAKQPKHNHLSEISTSTPKPSIDAHEYKKETPVWQIATIDNESRWSWDTVDKSKWKKLFLLV